MKALRLILRCEKTTAPGETYIASACRSIDYAVDLNPTRETVDVLAAYLLP